MNDKINIFYFQQNLNDNGYKASIYKEQIMSIWKNSRLIAEYLIETDNLVMHDKRHYNTIERLYQISFNQLTLF